MTPAYPHHRAITGADIAAAVKAAVAAERERCARIAESAPSEGDYYTDEDGEERWVPEVSATLRQLAARIRAGG